MSVTTHTRPDVLQASAIALAAVIALAGSDAGLSQSRSLLEIRTLSSRPDLVSGGDALVEVRAAAGTPITQLTLALNGKNVTSYLKSDPATGSYRGVIEGMTIGANTLLATAKTPKAEAKLTVINHPITGPILSGPHLTPYECNTGQSGLGPALDANCSAPRKIWYLYRSTDNAFKPLADPAGPRPADLATTTTNDGKTVPYIVRVDSGTIW